MADLKKLLQVLRRSIHNAGEHRFSRDAAEAALSHVVEQLEGLTQQRNDIAHMRLIFTQVPSDDSDEWRGPQTQRDGLCNGTPQIGVDSRRHASV